MLLTNKEKNQIAEDNYALVFYVVKMFRNSGVAYDELVSIASLGYAKALNAFDTERNVKFSTYAINCIRNEILFFLRKEKQHMHNNVSLNKILAVDKNGNNLSLTDTVSNQDNDELSLEDNVMLSEDLETVLESLSILNEKEKYIIIHRYGLFSQDIKTQKDIASDIGMSQANVSKMEKGILCKMQKILKSKYNMVYTGVDR